MLSVTQRGNKGVCSLVFTDSWEPKLEPIWIYQTVSLGISVNRGKCPAQGVL